MPSTIADLPHHWPGAADMQDQTMQHAPLLPSLNPCFSTIHVRRDSYIGLEALLFVLQRPFLALMPIVAIAGKPSAPACPGQSVGGQEKRYCDTPQGACGFACDPGIRIVREINFYEV